MSAQDGRMEIIMANFFDRVVYEVNKGVSSVSESSKSILEKSKLNGAISECEEQKLKIAQGIGIKIYNMYMSGAEIPEDVKADCDKITAKISEIRSHKQRLCTLKEQADANKFGTQASAAKKICKCGFENTPDSHFCAQCGEKLN